MDMDDYAEARGSSPHMRGALCSLLCPVSNPGIIPAYAGSTCLHRSAPYSRQDHPRICGEHPGVLFQVGPGPGSSPHMRGARNILGYQVSPSGIIPAYAGSTRGDVPSEGTEGDHPRICGEHSPSSVSPTGWAGSSPHMRGARARGCYCKQAARIIPAYAGSTCTGTK